MRESKPEFVIKNTGKWRFAIITTKWNQEFNDEMKESAIATLQSAGIPEENISVFESPGAFELPLMCLKLAKSRKFDAIICFATIIRGDTYHFEVVANESARGIMEVVLGTAVPILNGILTCNNTQQAQQRASREQDNKGKEVALSALALLSEFDKI
jgi:6,7-dimethyl-8-ribityllumazine synthase